MFAFSAALHSGLPDYELPRRPNVLLFMPDQQAAGTVLSSSPVIKPNVERFRREGVTFSSAHCPAPHCCPSRASLLTGLYPSEHGVFNNVTTDTAIHPNPAPGIRYWPQLLKASGYQTGYSGKLHVGRDIQPENCGFDNLCSLEQDTLQQNEARKSPQWREGRDLLNLHEPRRTGEIQRGGWPRLHMYSTLPDSSFEELADYKIVQAGIDGMKRMAHDERPWCLMISNSGAHDTYDAPKRFVDLYKTTEVQLPASFDDLMNDKPRIYQRQRYQIWSQLSEAEYKDAIRHYWAKCTMQDELFGMVLRALEETGQAENTIVIYVSDHGDYAGAHGLWFKGVPAFREAYEIPALIRWPRGITRPGLEVKEFVDQVDFAPTIMEACGISGIPVSGKSLVPFFKNEKPAQWRDHYCTQLNGVELYYTQRIVATKKWKYVYNGFDYDELYDLENDPNEMKNLVFPDLVAWGSGVRSGHGHSGSFSAWPPLPRELETVRREMLSRMWDFAAQHKDIIFNPYGTVALAPYGPGIGIDPGAGVR